MSKKKVIGIVLATALFLCAAIAPALPEIGIAGTKALIFTFAVLALLITEGLPAGFIGFLIFIMQPVLGLSSFAEAAATVGHTMFFFMIAAYAMSTAMTNVPVSRRILKFFIRHFGKSTKGLIFALCVSVAVVSTLVSNFPCMIMFLPIFIAFINLYQKEDERRQTAKPMLLLLPIAASYGGICTPIGNGCMMLGSSLLAEAGYRVSFPMWFCYGGPCAIVLLLVTFVIITKMFPPVELDLSDAAGFIKELDDSIPKKMAANEIITYVIIGFMLYAWFFTNLNATLVMCLVAIAFCFPAFRIMTWNDLMKNTSWDSILMITGIISVSTVLTKSGVSAWLADRFVDLVPASINPVAFIFMLGIFTFALLVLVPTCSAVTALVISPFIVIVTGMGLNPISIIVPLTFFTTFGLILPYDALFYVPFQKGYYSLKEFAVTGVVCDIVIVAVISLWSPIASKLLGLG